MIDLKHCVIKFKYYCIVNSTYLHFKREIDGTLRYNILCQLGENYVIKSRAFTYSKTSSSKYH